MSAANHRENQGDSALVGLRVHGVVHGNRVATRTLSGVDVDHHLARQRVQAALQFVVGKRCRHGQQRLHLERVTGVGGIDDLGVQLLDADAAVRENA